MTLTKLFSATSLALVTAVALAPTESPAITVKNCSGVSVRVHVYNNDDAAQIVARAGGKINAGNRKAWNVGSGRMAVKVFKTGLMDQLVVSRSNLGGKSGYHVALDNKGNWSVRDSSGGC